MRKIRVILDFWMARIGAAFGWICLVFWGMISVVAVVEKKEEPMDWAMIVICIGLTAVHCLLIRRMRATRELVEDFRLYSSMIAQGYDQVSSLSGKLNTPEKEVMKNLQKMCRRGYFHGHLDLSDRRLVLDTGEGQYVVRCPGCGATTAIYKTGNSCRYCGTPLVRKE